MPIDPIVARHFGATLWDARPTKTDKRAKQLAAALGYPDDWRVVRTISSTDTHPIIITDRIYAGDPSTDCDCWFHHAAAQKAAASWEGNPHAARGGHLLPRQARFNKGDKVQVFYEDEWWDAKIVRRREHDHGFRYQVHYSADNSKQMVPEDLIRERQDTEESRKPDVDPFELAKQLGFGEGWQAEASKGNKRYRITDPNGKVYSSKTKALEAFQSGTVATDTANIRDEGDPPWRTTGHDWLMRRVKRSHVQAVTSRRQVTVEQLGTITGWIAATDVDKAGNPGYRSEKTGEPAPLFHVDYDDDPNNPYPSLLMEFQDLEEFEIAEMLVDDNGNPTNEATAPPPAEST